MKKILSLLLAVVMLFGCCAMFASCGETPADTTTAAPSDGTTTAPQATTNIKAALIALHGTSSTYDKNFIDAFVIACQNKGLSADNYEIVTDIEEGTACYDAAADFADRGFDVIFADSFGHEQYMLQAAEEFPEVQFCHATGTQAHTANQSNYQNAFASIYEGRYLAGVAAGLKLLEMYGEDITDAEAKVGYVAAWPYAEVISGYTSWFLGVRSVVPNATMEVRYTNSWYDELAEKATAAALIDAGCTLISQHADSMGAPTACENAGIPNVAYNGVTGKTETFIIASKINWVPYFEYMLDCVINGTDIKTDYTGTIATESVQITVLGEAAAEGTQAKLDAVKAELAAGTLKVFDCSKFTVNGQTLTTYLADVDDDGTYTGETEVILTENGITYFAESKFRSAPYFNLIIDGITIGGQ